MLRFVRSATQSTNPKAQTNMAFPTPVNESAMITSNVHSATQLSFANCTTSKRGVSASALLTSYASALSFSTRSMT